MNQPQDLEQQDDEFFEEPREVTRLLKKWSEGNEEALGEVLPLVYDELKKVARCCFKRESQGHTLQATALVNEVYLQLINGRNLNFKDRNQFFYYAGQVMRHFLVGHARKRLAAKRGSGITKLGLDDQIDLSEGRSLDLISLIALDDALTKLEKIDVRQSRIIELRFFAGRNTEEIATLLDISPRTVKREWATAKCWLSRELGPIKADLQA